MSIRRLLLVIIILCGNFAVQAGSQADLQQALDTLKGRVVYLDFWASWCGPCRQSMPWLNSMQEKYQAQGLAVLSINLDSNRELAEKFLQQTPVSFPVIYDHKGKLSRQFKLTGMPSNLILDRQGNIISRHAGFSTQKTAQYEQQLRLFLAKK